MATDNWIGGNGDWTDPLGWQTDQAPAAADNVNIGAAGTYTVEIASPAAVSADDVSVASPGALLDVAAGGSLSLGGTLTLSSGGVTVEGIVFGGVIQDAYGKLQLNGGTLDGVTYQGVMRVSVANSASFAYDGLTIVGDYGYGPGGIDIAGDDASLTVHGGLNIAGSATQPSTILLNSQGATLDLEDSQALDDVSIVMEGGANAPAYFTVGSGATLTLGPNSQVTGENYGDITGPGTIVNQGKILDSYDTLTIDSLAFQNEGTLEVDSYSYFYVAPGDFLNLADDTLTGGKYVSNGGGMYFGSQISTLAADVTLVNGGDVYGDDVALEATLTSVGAQGALRVLGGQDYSTSNTLEIGGVVQIGGGALTTGGTTVESSGRIVGFGAVQGVLVNDGLVTASGGDLQIEGTVSGAGSFEIAPGAMLELGSGADSANVSFGGVGRLALDDPAGFRGAISGLIAGDIIDLAGEAASFVSLSGGVLTVLVGGAQQSFNLSGALSGKVFSPVSDGAGGTDCVLEDAAHPTIVTQQSGAYGYSYWSSPSSWIGGVAPAAGDNAAIVGIGQNADFVISSPTAADDVTFASEGAYLEIGSALALTGALQVEAGTVNLEGALTAPNVVVDGGVLDISYAGALEASKLSVTGGLVEVDGAIKGTTIDVNGGALDLTFGALDDVTFVGPLQLSADDYVNVTNGMTVTGAGEIDLGDAARLNLQSGAVQIGDEGGAGVINVEGAGSYLEIDGAELSVGSPTSAGTINLGGANSVAEFASGGLANVALVNVTGAGAILQFDYDESIDGVTIDLGGDDAQAAPALNHESAFGAQPLTLGPAVVVDQVGDYAAINANVFSGGEGAVVAAALAANSPASYSPSGIVNEGVINATYALGALSVTGQFINDGVINVANGETATIGGQLINGSSGEIDVSADGSGGALVVSALASWINQGQVTIGAGGLVDIAGQIYAASPASPASVGAVQLNGGELRIESSISTAELSGVANSGGVVDFNGALDNTDETLNVGAGSNLGQVNFNKGAVINGGAVDDNGGQAQFFGATFNDVAFDGAITLGAGQWLWLENFSSDDIVNVEAGGALYLWTASPDSPITPDEIGGITNDGGLVSIDGRYNNGDDTLYIGAGSALGQVEFDQDAVISGGSIVDGADGAQFFGATFDDVAYQGVITLGAGESLRLENFTSATQVDVETGGVLYLGSDDSPAMTPQDLTGIANSGGSVVIDGWLDNSDDTLDIGAGQPLGQVTLGVDGTIAGGVVDDAAGDMRFTGGTLDDVLLQGAITVADGEWLRMDNWVAGTALDIVGGEVDLFGPATASPGSPPSAPYSAALDINLSSGLLEINGEVGAAALGGVDNSGGQILIFGTLDNHSNALNIGKGGQLGRVALEGGGAIDGGTVDDAGLGLLFSPYSAASLNGVVFEGDLRLAQAGVTLDVSGGLTVEGDAGGEIDLSGDESVLTIDDGLTIGSTTNPGSININGIGAQIVFNGDETLDNVTITDSGRAGTSQTIEASDANGAGNVLTFGANAVIQADSGTLTIESGGYAADGVVNYGVVGGGGQIKFLGYVTNYGVINNTGYFSSNVSFAPYNGAGSFTNSGVLNVADDSYEDLSVNFVNTASGVINLGTFASLSVGSPTTNWSNAGAVNMGVDSYFDLYGAFDTASLNGVTPGANSVIYIGGVMNNVGAEFDVGAGTTFGSNVVWLQGGEIVGGVIRDAGAGLTIERGTLDDVVYQGVLSLNGAFYDANPLNIVGGLTVESLSGTGPGLIWLNGYDKKLNFEDTETLDGVTVDIGTTIGGDDALSIANGATLTLGAGSILNASGYNAYLDGAGAIIEKGVINAEYSNGSFYIDPASFTEQGSILVGGGTTFVITPTLFTNLAGGALTGGAYEIDSSSKLELASGATVTTLAANVTLSGANSIWETADSVTLESTLTEIAGAGALNVLNNRNYDTANDIRVAGALTLGGGSFSAGSLTVEAAGTLSGFGKVSALANDGLVTATGGTLDISGAVTGEGRLDIAAGAELEVGGAVAAGQTVSFGGAVGVLKLDDPANFKGTITGLVSGDTIDLADVAVTGFSVSPTSLLVDTAGGPISFALSGDLNGLSFSPTVDGASGTNLTLGASSELAVPSLSAASPLVLGDKQVNKLDEYVLGVTNAAGAGAGSLDVSVASATGGLQTVGSIGQLAPGQTGYIDIFAPTASAGAIAGAVVLDFSSEQDGVVTPLPSQTLNVEGAVYRLASGVVSSPTATPIVHVRDNASESLIVVNTAPSDGYSEDLVGSAGAAGAGFAVSGSTGEIAPGSSNNAIVVAIPTTQAGKFSSPISVNLTSDGTGVDGLGGTALGSQTVVVNATVDNYAAPDFQKVVAAKTDSAQLVKNSPTSYSFNFGLFDPDSPTVAADFELLNNAGLVADLLNGDYTISPTTVTSDTLGVLTVAAGSVFDQTGFDAFSNLKSEASGLPLEIDFDPVGDYGDNASFDEVITLRPTSSNASGYSGALSPVTLNITGAVSKVDEPDKAELEPTPDPVNFGDLHLVQPNYPGAGTQQYTSQLMTVTNSAKIGAADLIYWVAGVTGPAQYQGAPLGPPIVPQGSESAITLALSPPGSPLSPGVIAPGDFEGDISFGGASLLRGGLVSPLPDYETVDYDGAVYEYAQPVLTDNVGDVICDNGVQLSNAIYLPTVTSPTTFTLYASNNADPTYGDKLQVSSSETAGAAGITYSPSNQTLDGGAQRIAIGLIQVGAGANYGNPATLNITDYNLSSVAGFSGALPDPEIEVYANYSPSSPPPPPPAPKPPPPPPPSPTGGGGGGGWGDVHLITFSGLHYDFQAAGEFVAAKATDPTDPFEVQIRLQPYYAGSSVTVTTQVATLVGTDKVSFDLARQEQGQGFVWVDGAALTLNAADPAYQLSGGVITYVGPGTYRITYDKGETLLVSDEGAYLNFNITLGSGMGAGSVTGLDGVDASNPYDDLVLGPGAGAEAGTALNGESLPTSELYGQYADSWRVSPSSSLFYYAPGQSTATFTDKNFPADPLSINQIPAAVVAQATYLATQAGITDPTLLQDAILDYAETGNIDFITGAANLQSLGAAGAATANAGLVYSPPSNVASIVAIQTSIVQTPDAAATAKFLIQLNAPALSPVTVDYAAEAPGAGYLDAAAFGGALPSGSVNFTIGQQSVELDIATPANALGADPADLLQIRISAPSTESFIALGAPVASVDVKNSVAEPGAPAALSLEIASGAGALVRNGDDWTLDLGSFVAGAAFSPIEIAVVNTAAATADQLSGQASVVSGDAALANSSGAALGGYAHLNGGAIADAAVIDLDTAAGGVFTEVLSFSAVDVNASGYSNALTGQTLTIKATVTAVAPTISGTVAGQATTSEAPVDPFSGATVSDLNAGATDKLTIALSGASGSLADGEGFSGLSFAGGVYTLNGTASAVTQELRALVFTPAVGAPNTSATTSFTLTDASSADATPAVDATTTVTNQDPAVAPSIAGTQDGQTTSSEAPLDPFSGVTIADANANATDTLTIALSGGGGVLADGGGFDGLTYAGGVYTLTGTASAIADELRAVAFTPAAGEPGTSAQTDFTLNLRSSAFATPTADSTTSVIDSDLFAPVTVAQFEVYRAQLDATGAVTVADVWANVLPAIGALGADANVKAIDLTDASAPSPMTINAAQAEADGRGLGLISAPWNYSLTVEDSVANVADLLALGPEQLDALGAERVVRIAAIDGGSTLTVAEALALEGAGIALSAAPGYSDIVADTAGPLHKLTTTQIAGLVALGVTQIQATDSDVSLGAAQMAALAAGGITLREPGAAGSYEVIAFNTNGLIHDVAHSGITGQPYTSFDVLYGANGKPASATYSNGMTATWTYGDNGSLLDIAYAGVTGAHYSSYDIIYNGDGTTHDIDYTGITGQPYTSFDVVYGASGKPASATYSNGMTATWAYGDNGSLHDIAYAGVKGAHYSSYDIVYNGDGTTHDIDYAGITGQPYTSFDVVYGANGKPASATYSNGMSATWSYADNGSLHDIAYAGVTGAHYSSYDIVYNVDGTAHDIDYTGITGQPYTSFDVVYGANGKPASATYSNGMSATWSYADNGSLHDIAYVGVTGAHYSSYDIAYNADGTTHDIDYTGITGQPYTSFDVLYGANGKPASATYSNGMTATWTYADNGSLHDIAYAGIVGAPYTSYDLVYGANGEAASATYSNGMSETWSYNGDGSYETVKTGVGGNPASLVVDLYNTLNQHVAEGREVSSGSGALQLLQSGLTVSEGSGGLSVVSGADAFALNHYASESILAANTNGDIFDLTSGFGQTSITGFAAGGGNTDTLNFQLSMFDPSWFTPGMTMDEEALALLSHATGATNTVITDNSGDTLTLVGVSRATMTSNPGAIRFT
jgi:hypothetical protein